MRRATFLLLTILAGVAPAAGAMEVSVSLRGSKASMIRQNEVARAEDFTFLSTPGQVREYVEKGYLVPLRSGPDFEVKRSVSFPYARPETRSFVEWIAPDYRAACGESLVVTSLTRPQVVQPRNAHELSVHPTGMAVDMRISRNAACRDWLEDRLLALEKEGVLDVTRERNPPHYHVAVFPDPFQAYLKRIGEAPAPAAQSPERPGAAPETRAGEPAHPGGQGGGVVQPGGGVPTLALVLVTLGFLLFFWSERGLGFRGSGGWE